MSEKLSRIVFEHNGETVTCAVGERIEIETPKRGRRGKIDYLAPLRRFDAARIVAIKDEGTMYHVFWDPSSGLSAWANPIVVNKHDALRVE